MEFIFTAIFHEIKNLQGGPGLLFKENRFFGFLVVVGLLVVVGRLVVVTTGPLPWH